MTISITDKEALGEPQEGEVVLEVKGISKKFCRDLRQALLYGVQDIATEVLGIREKSERLRSKEFWALKDVNLQLRRGEALGLVGPNGSGKTTLLRIISGLIKPDIGSVEFHGRLAPLIALGAGFNPILTGRENIYVNMSILGLSKKEISERFHNVVEFAEIGDAIDAPVQSYSSGMAARLGFASAIHTEPEILLVDEVLAVGDMRFKAKCYRKLHELRQNGTSFILVNHNPQAILNVCDSATYLSNGALVMSGNTELVMQKYENDLFLNKTEKSSGIMFAPEKSVNESLGVDIVSLSFKNAEEKIIELPLTGEPIKFCIDCKAYTKTNDVNLHLKITELGGQGGTVLFMGGGNDEKFFELLPGKHEIQVQLPYLGLKPGTYNMSVKLKKGSLYTLDLIESFRFTVISNGKMSQCMFYQPRSWEIVSNENYS